MAMTLHESTAGRPLPDVIQDAGLVGCGGAGFPTYAKYRDKARFHLTNAQESEPGYCIDKWLHREHPERFAELYRWLLDWGCEKILVGAKMKDRAWLEPLEKLLDAEVLDCQGKQRHDLDTVSNPFIFAYTSDVYAFGRETALILVLAQLKLGPDERPADRGFIVNNTQTLLNMHQALTTGRPVTEKYVHVYGETPTHLFARTPIGTTADDVLRAAGSSLAEVKEKGWVLAEGGPGWFDKVADPDSWVVTRRTNALLVIDPEYADPDGRDLFHKGAKKGYPNPERAEPPTEPGADLEPATVRVSLKDNQGFAAVAAAVSVVSVGDAVERGQVIARPADDGFSVPAHASIDGKVTTVDERAITISRG